MKTVLFYRTFRHFSGGHLKVWHYFNHVRHAPHYVPRICLGDGSLRDARNPWHGLDGCIVKPGTPTRADVVFLAGMDWLNLPEAERTRSPVPIINLIQHVRHARPNDARHPFLRHRAIRICVSAEVAEALREAPRVEGPLFVIPNALDAKALPKPIPAADRDLDLLIVANKQPLLGRVLWLRLRRSVERVHLLTRSIERSEFLRLLSRARSTVFLPHRSEGFYLPALEGMALGTVVVCPDCVGNRSFCLPNRNCFRPAYSLRAVAAAAEAAVHLQPGEVETLLNNGRETSTQHDLVKERAAFLEILRTADDLW